MANEPKDERPKLRIRKAETGQLRTTGSTPPQEEGEETRVSIPEVDAPAPATGEDGVQDPVARRDTRTTRTHRVNTEDDTTEDDTVVTPTPQGEKNETARLRVVREKRKQLDTIMTDSQTISLRPSEVAAEVEASDPVPENSDTGSDTVELTPPEQAKRGTATLRVRPRNAPGAAAETGEILGDQAAAPKKSTRTVRVEKDETTTGTESTPGDTLRVAPPTAAEPADSGTGGEDTEGSAAGFTDTGSSTVKIDLAALRKPKVEPPGDEGKAATATLKVRSPRPEATDAEAPEEASTLRLRPTTPDVADDDETSVGGEKAATTTLKLKRGVRPAGSASSTVKIKPPTPKPAHAVSADDDTQVSTPAPDRPAAETRDAEGDAPKKPGLRLRKPDSDASDRTVKLPGVEATDEDEGHGEGEGDAAATVALPPPAPGDEPARTVQLDEDDMAEASAPTPPSPGPKRKLTLRKGASATTPVEPLDGEDEPVTEPGAAQDAASMPVPAQAGAKEGPGALAFVTSFAAAIALTVATVFLVLELHTALGVF